MSTANWQKAKEVFLRVRNAAPPERAALLDTACAGDPDLRAEVESLLDNHDSANDTFLEVPVVRFGTAAPPPNGSDPRVDSRIGQYEILHEIAAGGMGVVYAARQENPGRIVALKVARTGLGSASARRRFAQEAAILARLQHPGIAQVYEAGAHREGGSATPFFAMEYVDRAQPITDYAAAEKLSTAQRLTLFADVCDAVHYGHQRGVVHRDLKPGNILIDGTGRPKVIDFGVARIVDPDATVATMQTASGQVLGTLQYMSPEQFSGDPEQVDVRSDVYALGVVLYELLCCELPYDATTSGLYGAARAIQHEPPKRPSASRPALRGDLETILLKCLQKEPARRYGSAAELAGDLHRHLRGEPIDARRDSAIYVLRKNLYRYRAIVAAVLALAVGGMIYAGTVTALWRDAAHERHVARVWLGRSRVHDGMPLAAAEPLWREFFRRDSNRSRFALWELASRYPRIWANETFGQQTDVAYSPSGRWLATVTLGGQIILYDAASGDGTLPDAGAALRATEVEFAPGGDGRLYVGTASGGVHTCAFDEDTGQLQPVQRLFGREDLSAGDAGPVSRLAISPDGQWLAVAHHAGRETESGAARWHGASISVWDTAAQEVIWSRRVEERTVGGLAFAPDGQRIGLAFSTSRAISSGGGTEIWRAADGSVLQASSRNRRARRGIAFSADGKRIFSATQELVAAKISAPHAALEEVPCASAGEWGLRTLVRGPQAHADYLVFATGDGLIHAYDTVRDEFCRTFGYHDCDQNHVDVAFAPDGSQVASVGPDGLSVWHFRPGRWIGPTDDALKVSAISADGGLIAVWQLRADSPARLLILTADGTKTVAAAGSLCTVSDDGRRCALQTFTQSRTSREEDTPPCGRGWPVIVLSEAPAWSRPVGAALEPDVAAAALAWLDPTGRQLLVGLSDGRVLIWNADAAVAGEAAPAEQIHAFTTTCTRFATDARRKWLVASSEGRTDGTPAEIAVWRATGAPAGSDFATAYTHHASFRVPPLAWHVALVYDRDRRPLVVTAGNRRDIELWDAHTGEYVDRLTGHGDEIWHCIALDERRIVAASGDGTVRIWDVAERAELCVLHRQAAGRPSLAVAGTVLAISDGGRLWTYDLTEFDAYIERNRDYERRRLTALDAHGDTR